MAEESRVLSTTGELERQSSSGGVADGGELPEEGDSGDGNAPEHPTDEQSARQIDAWGESRKPDSEESGVPRDDEDRPLVLVVEDSPTMNRYIRETLSERVCSEPARDGREGLEKALELDPDLIISDVMMPEMDGVEFVETLRSHPEVGEIPIVMVTARADDDLRVRLLREGAQDYVMKPFSAEELNARVNNLLSMWRTRKLLQRELRSQQNDLEDLATELTDRKRRLQTVLESMRVARDQAERASRVKSRFLGLVSHELRTPLASFQLYLDVLKRDSENRLSDEQHEVLGKLEGAADRLTDLVESLLKQATIESGKLSTQFESFDPMSVAVSALDRVRPQADKNDLELKLSSGSNLGELTSDPRVVRLILINLLSNGIKYTSDGEVELRVSRDGPNFRFSVRDTGPGISPSERVRIFKPFVQTEESTREQVEGVGLGLALVREMTRALGGRISLDSEVGEGSVFTVVLPAEPDS